MDPMFTIVVPTYQHGCLLRYALQSIEQQTIQDFEVFIICDGAVDEGRDIAWEYARQDHRFRVWDRPKGARNGEAYRHEALLTARGKFVCYLSDDDLWFPHHLQRMKYALVKNDFVHSRYVAVSHEDNMVVIRESLDDDKIRELMMSKKFNIFGPSIAGHRMDTYQRLPEGWAPGPDDIWSDLNMWRKFLRLEDIKIATIHEVTALILPSPFRAAMTLQDRESELAIWSEKIKDSFFRDSLQDLFY